MANTSKKISKYFTLLPVLWVERKNPAFSPIKYHFRCSGEMEKHDTLSGYASVWRENQRYP